MFFRPALFLALVTFPLHAEVAPLLLQENAKGYAEAAKNSTAEIFCHPGGRFLYVSNCGHDSIAVFAIAEDGKVTLVQNAPADVKVPRGFAIPPDGGWLVAAGQNSNSLASRRIDPATGKLTPAPKVDGIGAPVCVVFAISK